MARRKPWAELSDGVRRRYLRNGITAADHAQGVSLQTARGHATTPEHGGPSYSQRALTHGVDGAIPYFRTLPPRERNRFGRVWMTMFEPAKGPRLTPAEREARGITGKRVARHPSDAQVYARMDLIEFLAAHNTTEREFWKRARIEYMNHFSAAA